MPLRRRAPKSKRKQLFKAKSRYTKTVDDLDPSQVQRNILSIILCIVVFNSGLESG